MDRWTRQALINWLEEYQDYVVSVKLQERPRAIQLDGMPKNKGYKDPTKRFLHYHNDNEEANRRLQAVQNIKDIGDEYELYGDILYYRYMVGLPTDQLLERLENYSDLLDSNRYIPTVSRVSRWTTKALLCLEEMIPQQWYLNNKRGAPV